jgi:hypothetical protein
MDRIETFFLQAVAVSTVAIALCAGLSLAKPTPTEQLPLVKLERVIATPTTDVAQTSVKANG